MLSIPVTVHPLTAAPSKLVIVDVNLHEMPLYVALQLEIFNA
jgi:hypothetical protein